MRRSVNMFIGLEYLCPKGDSIIVKVQLRNSLFIKLLSEEEDKDFIKLVAKHSINKDFINFFVFTPKAVTTE